MTNEEDAQKRAVEEIREAASLTPAVHKTASSMRAPDSADSSGIVDLAALLAADPDWIHRAIDASRIRAEALRSDRDAPKEAAAQPKSLAPVALSSLVDPADVATA